MPISQVLRSFLKEHDIKYRAVFHPSAYTAQQLAHTQHIHGDDVIKVVLLKSGGASGSGFVMAILPASYKVDFAQLRKILGTDQVRLGTEEEMREKFPDCEIGAMPPFGNLYHLPLYADESLNKKGEVLIPAGSHRDAILLNYKDLEKWTKPKTGKIAVHA